MALPAVVDAGDAHPLKAALDAISAGIATFGEDWPVLLREVRAMCVQAGGDGADASRVRP
ncbi:hypothetical protein ACFV9W_25350 [Streptomyces sp. NPDC059897]|uniref:hypothetical protein n=1 Tax=Streptomyces sp. NPDC059897 TaxID=3346994 RepID=UPI00364A6ED7